MPGLGTRDEALTSPAANERDPWCREHQGHFMMKHMQRAPVYFETVFAYFAAMIKRPFGVLCGRHWNPVGQDSFLQLRQQPAIIFPLKVKPITCWYILFPTAFQFPSSTAGVGVRVKGEVGDRGGERQRSDRDR